ncbi:xaa-Pro dipeptidase [Salvia hispanica]|uniref:xaa-Pro dipeptidase n=1 Tax=Salvia hispanica TaxID=49212 RepID=UPI002009BC9B|nr:xaa-Pro dipeptidase [Salvia hispanica]
MGSPSSLSPPEVPMQLHVANRNKLLDSFRDHLSISSRNLHGFILLQGGEEQNRYCTDHIELFRQESYFAYLFGVQEPGFYGAIDIASGDSILFAPRLPADYAVWLGEIKPTSYFKESYMVSSVYYTDEIAKVLNQQYRGPGKPLLYLLHGLNTDSNNFSKPAHFEGIDNFETDLNALHPILTECRVLKSAFELAVIQFANDISSEAHVEVMRKTKVGMKEYQLESMFLHHTYMYGGCRHCSYTCICATGSNSSVLHYGHAAAPNDRIFEDGDMALLDMGAEYHFYGSDITCSFPVNGKFTDDQSLIYNAVLLAHDAVISNMRPGVSWVDMHILAERTILESLKKGNLLLGDVDAMVQERIGAVFIPHGLGHLLGIDTHDPGGYLKGAERPKEPGLKSLRTSRELLEGMVITVEPGCYFIDALLLPAMENAQTSKFFNRHEISRFRGFGGVRIESDVYVSCDGCVNMTKCPRTIKDIEAVMAGAPWPINTTTIPSISSST